MNDTGDTTNFTTWWLSITNHQNKNKKIKMHWLALIKSICMGQNTKEK